MDFFQTDIRELVSICTDSLPQRSVLHLLRRSLRIQGRSLVICVGYQHQKWLRDIFSVVPDYRW